MKKHRVPALILLFLVLMAHLTWGDEKQDRLAKAVLAENLLNTPRAAATAAEIEALTDFYSSMNGDSWYGFSVRDMESILLSNKKDRLLNTNWLSGDPCLVSVFFVKFVRKP